MKSSCNIISGILYPNQYLLIYKLINLYDVGVWSKQVMIKLKAAENTFSKPGMPGNLYSLKPITYMRVPT